MTPYLNRPLRSKAEVVRDILANCADTFLVIDMSRRGEPYVREDDIGQSFQAVVSAIVAGEYDLTQPRGPTQTPLAVIRISLRDNEAEDVTEKVALAVLEHLKEQGDARDCPFLDEVLPDWRQRSGLKEVAA